MSSVKLKLKLIGTGKDDDPFRTNFPEYSILEINQEEKWAIIETSIPLKRTKVIPPTEPGGTPTTKVQEIEEIIRQDYPEFKDWKKEEIIEVIE